LQFIKGAFPLKPKKSLYPGCRWGQQQGETKNLTRPSWTEGCVRC